MTANNIDLSNLQDHEDLYAAFEQLEKGAEPTAQPTETPPTDPAPVDTPKTDTEPPTTTQPQGTSSQEDPAGQDPEPQGVATKNGSHIIPYSVLKSERERATRAEQMLQEVNSQLAALQQQGQPGSQGANNGERARTAPTNLVSDLSEEDLAALKEDFPTVFKALQIADEKFQQLESKLNPVENSVRQAEAERAQSVTESVQDAIDSIPKLAHIQASDQAAFELAIQFDATLRESPAWADKPLSERFQKATEMVEAALGTIAVPGAAKPSAPQLSPEEAKKAALAKASEAAKATKAQVPVSLSEAPAGVPAATDEQEAAEQMSSLQLAEKFSAMTPDQMEAYFQSL